MTLQFFSPTAKDKDGGVVISMPQDKVTKSAVQALVDGTSGLSGARVDVSLTCLSTRECCIDLGTGIGARR